MEKHVGSGKPSDWSYKVNGCRCDQCMSAHSQAMREYRERRRIREQHEEGKSSALWPAATNTIDYVFSMCSNSKDGGSTAKESRKAASS